MTYSIGHKAKTRQRILEAANRLFTANGFEATSIDQIMSECNLTRGGFYAHFSSKGQLYREAIVQGTCFDAVLGECLGTAQPAPKLSPAFAFLAVDVASKTPEVRAAFTNAFTSISEKLLRRSNARAGLTENCCLSTAALIVGALAVANTTDNLDLKAKVLASCKESAEALLAGSECQAPALFWEPAAN